MSETSLSSPGTLLSFDFSEVQEAGAELWEKVRLFSARVGKVLGKAALIALGGGVVAGTALGGLAALPALASSSGPILTTAFHGAIAGALGATGIALAHSFAPHSEKATA
jgi:hypothetical protein